MRAGLPSHRRGCAASPPPTQFWRPCLAGTSIPAFRPLGAVQADGRLPVALTVVGREGPEVAATVAAFIAAARIRNRQLKLIDVPEGQHGFAMLDHTDCSRDAVRQAMAWVTEKLHA